MNRKAVITGILMIVVFFIGFGLGRMTDGMPGIESIPASIADDERAQDAPSTPASSDGQSGGTTIDTSNLSDSQRSMLRALGVDADSITITPEMIACAENALGAARIEEIRNGATPSLSEGASLIGCYR